MPNPKHPESYLTLSPNRFHSLSDYLRTPCGRQLDFTGLENVAWHVSAGQDYAPITTWAAGYQTEWKQRANIPAPSIHIFTCLSADHDEKALLEMLKSPDRILFQKGRTRMTIKKYEFVRFGDRVPLMHRHRHCDLNRGTSFASHGADGFLADVIVEDIINGHQEVTRLLYLFSDNITTFHNFVTNKWVTVRYLAASCEGLAFGGCKHSIFQLLERQQHYPDNPHCDIKWIISPTDHANFGNNLRRNSEYAAGLSSKRLGDAAGSKGSVYEVISYSGAREEFSVEDTLQKQVS